MRQHTALLVSLVAGTVFFSACSDTTQPGTPAPESVGLEPVQGPDDPVALVRGIPGFGGFFFDREGVPTVYLRDVAARAQVERALGPWLAGQDIRPAALRVRRADYDWASLERWQGGATGAALSMRGTVWVDADEARNRVTIGVERGTPAAQVRAAVARLGVPSAAVVIEEVEPVRFAATLQNRVRPVVGGLQINFPGFLCTLGFNALRSSQRSFITNSHCTNVQGGVNSTPYWQPLKSTDPVQIATEVADPNYVSGGACPAGRRCRRSDSSRASYANGIAFTIGRIAQTIRPGRSLSITGQWTITGEGVATVGQTVNKVGRTTGWSQGPVTNTCVDTNLSGSDITELCQTFVSATVGSGDSGSPIFAIGSGSNVSLLGILWGGSGSNLFVYSPIANVHDDLGSFAVK